MRKIVSVLSLFILMGGGAVSAQAAAEREVLRETGNAFAQIAKEALPAVVFIDVESTIEVPQYGYRYQPFRDLWGRRGQLAIPQELEPKKYSKEGLGSGFIISKDGYILTNNHVVNDADRITVILADDRKFSAKVIGSDPKTEVALIKIDDPHELPFLELGDSDALQVGEWVLAAGNPFGLSQTVTAGIVSAKGRDEVGIAEYANFIQTDAAINPGNSGGPLLDIDGKVVGINTAIYSRSGGYMGIGFAIPINQAIQIKDQLIKHGKISRSVLGVYIQDVNEELANSFGLDERGGILISQIIEDSAAEEAGLQGGDIIVELNGKKVGKMAAFRNRIAATPPNSKITLKIFRDGKYKNISAITKAMEGESGAQASAILDEIGISVEDLGRATARQFGYTENSGVLVTAVKQDSPAWEAGLQPGHLITSANRKSVEDADEFAEALADAKGRRILFLVSDGRSSRYIVVNRE
ncbi:DegQ family serine endoprotease [Pontiellaceae bacterium B1224]|nr:DegQ family serine endoprotease [Pontiellaceae bacterium B1224]